MLLFRLVVLFSCTLFGLAHAEQIHVSELGVGVTLGSVVEKPTWALIKQEDSTGVYTAWVGGAAALVTIETEPDSERIVRFSVKIPGAGEGAGEVFQVLRNTWGALHEAGSDNKLERRITCQDTTKETITQRLKVGGLYEILMTPTGSHPQGVVLSTQIPPHLGPILGLFLQQVDDGVMAGPDPDWSQAYLAQKQRQADAREAARNCKPNRPFSPPSVFTLGQRIDKQKHFSLKNGVWLYDGLYEAYELVFADAQAQVDAQGRLIEMLFTRENISPADFSVMAYNAKFEMGPALSWEQSITKSGNKATYLWKTPAGAVELSLYTMAASPQAGQLSLRYFLWGED